MNTQKKVKKPVRSIQPSKYWAQYWYPWPVGIIATLQLIMTLLTISMEIGNAVVDLFRANVYTGFWAFPFMISATMATYACVCSTRTQLKAIIALILQSLSIIVMIIVIGFLMAFIATNFTFCLGVQCSQSSSTTFSSSAYKSLKQAFISCEIAASIIYIMLSIMYIIFFVKCYKKLPRIYRKRVRPVPVQSIIGFRQSSTLSEKSRPWSMSVTSYNQSDFNEESSIVSSAAPAHIGAQKVCPNCKHVSPYDPRDNIIECPNCKYQSTSVEHAQQS